MEWLRLGDGKNAYFHASLKSKQRQTKLDSLKDENGDTLHHQDDIEPKITRYYKKLIGNAIRNLSCIDIVAMGKGPQLSEGQGDFLTAHITENEILSSLKGMKNLSAPGIDGYNAKFFKSTWDIIKYDTIKAIMDFFERKKIYRAINSTLVTLIPKTTTTDMVRDFRPISCCIVICKLISRIMAARLRKILSSVIHSS